MEPPGVPASSPLAQDGRPPSPTTPDEEPVLHIPPVRAKVSRGVTKVILNVYDLNPTDAKKKYITNANNWSMLVGIGAFHSSVEIHGIEWSFGSSSDKVKAIQPCLPRKCCPNQYSYRLSVDIGTTELDPNEVNDVIAEFCKMEKYFGTSYNLLKNNCNDFSDHLCRRLSGNGIPKWVNRGARTLDKLVEGADSVAKHPVTKSVGKAINVAGQGVKSGVTVGIAAMKKSIEVSSIGLRALVSRIDGMECMGGRRLLQSCYGEESKGMYSAEDSDEELLPPLEEEDDEAPNKGFRVNNRSFASAKQATTSL